MQTTDMSARLGKKQIRLKIALSGEIVLVSNSDRSMMPVATPPRNVNKIQYQNADRLARPENVT